jgi:hypothetical protein
MLRTYATEEGKMSKSTAAKNKAIVLEAFETLFNKRDYAAADSSDSLRVCRTH